MISGCGVLTGTSNVSLVIDGFACIRDIVVCLLGTGLILTDLAPVGRPALYLVHRARQVDQVTIIIYRF